MKEFRVPRNIPAVAASAVLALCALIALLSPISARAGGASPPEEICQPGDDLPIDGLADLPVCPDEPEAPPRAPDPNLDPPDFTRERLTSRTIVIDRPGTFDFGGELLIWSGREECKPQSNPVPILDIRASNVTIKNLAFRGSPGGVRVSGINVKFENITAWSCWEALTTTEGADRISIKNSRFYGHPEHDVMLLNLKAGDVSIDQSLFAEASACVVFGGGQTIGVTNSDFFGCETSFHGDTRAKNRLTILDSQANESWHGTTFFHLISQVRGTSVGDLVYDGEIKVLEKDAHLIER
jgi:hypothetical protein